MSFFCFLHWEVWLPWAPRAQCALTFIRRDLLQPPCWPINPSLPPFSFTLMVIVCSWESSRTATLFIPLEKEKFISFLNTVAPTTKADVIASQLLLCNYPSFWARLTLADWALHRTAALANEPSLNIVKLARNDSGSRPGAIDRLSCWLRSQMQL